MLIVGLTGGIGSGKSTVAEIFRRWGVPIVDADIIARQLVEPGQPALAEIVAAFGAGILDAAGALDRARLRTLVFNDAARRKRLEEILHPRIRREMLRQAQALQTSYCVFVIPLLFETGQRELVDRVLVVDTDEKNQEQRLQARDGLDASTIHGIMAAQIDRQTRLAAADDIVTNNGAPQDLEAEVERLHRFYLGLAGIE